MQDQPCVYVKGRCCRGQAAGGVSGRTGCLSAAGMSGCIIYCRRGHAGEAAASCMMPPAAVCGNVCYLPLESATSSSSILQMMSLV